MHSAFSALVAQDLNISMQPAGGRLLAAGLDGGDTVICSLRGANVTSPSAPAPI